MNMPMEQKRLEDILDAYVASGVGPNSPLGRMDSALPRV